MTENSVLIQQILRSMKVDPIFGGSNPPSAKLLLRMRAESLASCSLAASRGLVWRLRGEHKPSQCPKIELRVLG